MNARRIEIKGISIDVFVKILDSNFKIKYQNHSKLMAIMIGERNDWLKGSLNSKTFVVKQEKEHLQFDIIYSISNPQLFDFMIKNDFFNEVLDFLHEKSAIHKFTFKRIL